MFTNMEFKKAINRLIGEKAKDFPESSLIITLDHEELNTTVACFDAGFKGRMAIVEKEGEIRKKQIEKIQSFPTWQKRSILSKSGNIFNLNIGDFEELQRDGEKTFLMNIDMCSHFASVGHALNMITRTAFASIQTDATTIVLTWVVLANAGHHTGRAPAGPLQESLLQLMINDGPTAVLLRSHDMLHEKLQFLKDNGINCVPRASKRNDYDDLKAHSITYRCEDTDEIDIFMYSKNPWIKEDWLRTRNSYIMATAIFDLQRTAVNVELPVESNGSDECESLETVLFWNGCSFRMDAAECVFSTESIAKGYYLEEVNTKLNKSRNDYSFIIHYLFYCMQTEVLDENDPEFAYPFQRFRRFLFEDGGDTNEIFRVAILQGPEQCRKTMSMTFVIWILTIIRGCLPWLTLRSNGFRSCGFFDFQNKGIKVLRRLIEKWLNRDFIKAQLTRLKIDLSDVFMKLCLTAYDDKQLKAIAKRNTSELQRIKNVSGNVYVIPQSASGIKTYNVIMDIWGGSVYSRAIIVNDEFDEHIKNASRNHNQAERAAHGDCGIIEHAASDFMKLEEISESEAEDIFDVPKKRRVVNLAKRLQTIESEDDDNDDSDNDDDDDDDEDDELFNSNKRIRLSPSSNSLYAAEECLDDEDAEARRKRLIEEEKAKELLRNMTRLAGTLRLVVNISATILDPLASDDGRLTDVIKIPISCYYCGYQTSDRTMHCVKHIRIQELPGRLYEGGKKKLNSIMERAEQFLQAHKGILDDAERIRSARQKERESMLIVSSGTSQVKNGDQIIGALALLNYMNTRNQYGCVSINNGEYTHLYFSGKFNFREKDLQKIWREIMHERSLAGDLNPHPFKTNGYDALVRDLWTEFRDVEWRTRARVVTLNGKSTWKMTNGTQFSMADNCVQREIVKKAFVALAPPTAPQWLVVLETAGMAQRQKSYNSWDFDFPLTFMLADTTASNPASTSQLMGRLCGVNPPGNSTSNTERILFASENVLNAKKRVDKVTDQILYVYDKAYKLNVKLATPFYVKKHGLTKEQKEKMPKSFLLEFDNVTEYWFVEGANPSLSTKKQNEYVAKTKFVPVGEDSDIEMQVSSSTCQSDDEEVRKPAYINICDIELLKRKMRSSFNDHVSKPGKNYVEVVEAILDLHVRNNAKLSECNEERTKQVVDISKPLKDTEIVACMSGSEQEKKSVVISIRRKFNNTVPDRYSRESKVVSLQYAGESHVFLKLENSYLQQLFLGKQRLPYLKERQPLKDKLERIMSYAQASSLEDAFEKEAVNDGWRDLCSIFLSQDGKEMRHNPKYDPTLMKTKNFKQNFGSYKPVTGKGGGNSQDATRLGGRHLHFADDGSVCWSWEYKDYI